MRIFVTGATGFVGSAVVEELMSAGHKVLGLARNDAAADALKRIGAEVRRGDLSDPKGLSLAALECDGVVHTAYNHDWSQIPAAAEIDRRAIEAFGNRHALAHRLRNWFAFTGTSNHRRRLRRSSFSWSSSNAIGGNGSCVGVGERPIKRRPPASCCS
jgi:nucleoside-diphosphate-sugar epimerase